METKSVDYLWMAWRKLGLEQTAAKMCANSTIPFNIIKMTYNTTTEDDNLNAEPQITWFGEEVLFHIGSRPIKIWELIVGLIILSIIMPLLMNLTRGVGRRNEYRNGRNGRGRGGKR
jgi:hypothetical protein